MDSLFPAPAVHLCESAQIAGTGWKQRALPVFPL
jgi:hypothetical protein